MATRKGKADPVGPADDTVMTGHYMVRDGDFWTCLHCKDSWPFGGGMPDLTDARCTPRRWGDGL